jgi:aminoglycoside phosphotransferase (APT) family kinase protein
MGREFRILSALEQVYPYAPRPLHFCTDQDVLGCDFYLMSCIDGIVIRKDYPPRMVLTPQQVRQQFFTLFDVLGELHSVDLKKAGLESFGKPEGYVRRQVEGWSWRFGDARTPDAPDFDPVMQWLDDRMPADSGLARIIHNDYKLDNVIWSAADPLQLIGVLDWEMAHLGDPLEDLGWSLQPVWTFGRAGLAGGLCPPAQAIAIWERASGLVADPVALRWTLFNCVKGQGIWVGLAAAFNSGGNRAPIMIYPAWWLINAQERAMAQLMGHL